MATKRLSKSVAEGGHTEEYKRTIALTERQLRRRTKRYCKDVERHPEHYESESEPKLRVWTRWCERHRSNVRAMDRWLAHQVGRPWSEVRSDAKQKLGALARTARLGVYEWRISDDVDERGDGVGYAKYDSYFVDDDGILRERVKERWPRQRQQRQEASVSKADLERWLKGRRIWYGGAGHTLFWFVPVRPMEVVSRTMPCYLHVDRVSLGLFERLGSVSYKDVRYFKGSMLVRHVEILRQTAAAYRQDRALDDKELAFYERLTDKQKKACREDTYASQAA